MIEQTQGLRQARVSTMLGEDVVLLDRLTSDERLSEPFAITLHVISEHGEVDFLPCLGSGVSITMQASPQIARAFHGVLWEAEQIGENPQGLVYRLGLRPWTSLVALGLNTRIFQNKSTPDIVREVIDGAGFSDYDLTRLTGAYKPREYCVQFRESDFSFVSRLLEEEGICYFFEHHADSHVLVLADAPSCHAPNDDLDSVPCIRPGAARARRRAHRRTGTSA